MALKKYTLYFNGKNQYGHSYDFPIITLDLKSIDKYTSNYSDFYELYDYLPNEIKLFLSNNLFNKIDFNIKNRKNINKLFYISDKDNNNVSPIFINDIDILFITPNEIDNFIIDKVMSNKDFQSVLLKTKKNDDLKKKYSLFEYLYNNYVKDKKIICMLDTYDIENSFPNEKKDKLYIASLATNKDNIIILNKKIGQNNEEKRTLALYLKSIFLNKKEKLIDSKILEKRKTNDLDINKLYENIMSNLYKFKKTYEDEYN